MSVKDRILKYCQVYEIKPGRFERECGLSNSYLSKLRHEPSRDKIESILNAYPNLNGDWLLSGEGEMLKSSGESDDSNTSAGRRKVSRGAHIKNAFTNATNEEIEAIIADEFAKHLLEMYEEGRAYPAVFVDHLRADLAEAQRRVGELSSQLESLRNKSTSPDQ